MRAHRALAALLCVYTLWLLHGSSLAADPKPDWDDQPAAAEKDAPPQAEKPTPPKPIADKPLPPRYRPGMAPQPDRNAPQYGPPSQPGRTGDRPPDPYGPYGGPGAYPGMPGPPGMPTMPPGGQPNWQPGFPGIYDNRRFEELKQYDPEMYELEKSDADLERQTHELSQRLRSTPRDQREALEKQIAEVVEKHFDVRQSRRQLQLKRLQEELEQLRTAIDRRNQIRTEIVQRRVAELTGKTSELDF
jgi:hypothetical protein